MGKRQVTEHISLPNSGEMPAKGLIVPTLAREDVGVAGEAAPDVDGVLGVSDHVGGVFVVDVGND